MKYLFHKSLSVFIALILCSWLVACNSSEEKSADAKANEKDDMEVDISLDHIILAVQNLDSGMAEFEQLTGIKPVFGGVHPGRGTHNALVSAGEGTYIEIIAPQPGLDADMAESLLGLYEYEKLTPAGWAIRTSDIEAVREMLINMTIDVSEIYPGNRKTPSGKDLAWKSFGVMEEVEGLPFFIQWSPNSAHPSLTSPGTVTVAELSLYSPVPKAISKITDTLKLPVTVLSDEKTKMEITLLVNGKEVQFPANSPDQ